MLMRSDIPALLFKGLNSVFFGYESWPEQWKEIYKIYRSDQAEEIDIEMKGLGYAGLKDEGSAMVFGNMGERIKTHYFHKTIALAFQITKEAIEDNLYMRYFNTYTEELKESLRATKEVLGCDILNRAFDSAYAVGDGKSLCANDHPIDGSTYSNVLGNTQLSETALEEALTLIESFPAQSGLLTKTKARKLIVPRNLGWQATRILNSQFKTNTANNDISAVYHLDAIPQGHTVNQYLTSPTAWFLTTDASNGFKYFQRTSVQLGKDTDFLTNNFRYKAEERYSFGVSNPRAVVGSTGTAGV